MEWNRGARPTQPAGAPVNHETGAHGAPAKRGKVSLGGLRLASVFLLFAGTILVVAVLAYIGLGGSNSSAGQYVDDKKMQAVFLNGGQVYFGNITDINDKNMQVKNIYYLRVNQQVQPNQTDTQAANDISLVKLGCELHGPQDSMVINQDQVIFWENLKDDGQVAKAVAEYKKANPDGQKCDTAAADNTTNTTNTQSTTPTTTNTTPTTNNRSTTTTPTTNR